MGAFLGSSMLLGQGTMVEKARAQEARARTSKQQASNVAAVNSNLLQKSHIVGMHRQEHEVQALGMADQPPVQRSQLRQAARLRQCCPRSGGEADLCCHWRMAQHVWAAD